ncbi:hypothetical protein O6H91_12G002000 [Diphasiastrum complanatum]|uniref:Uncharacterized protein n=2 Tax=Diphasiastrum complanatum TaxID=34168 RepID=A0ACC2BY97_DIPCM|nr:hypothetical protein O6H91_12G001800 [Diphasiastrum complanatum]KAJ7534747.1 hypothetical protein O6H91_12G002000 [Diphasiastrum complanatum]
MAQVSLHTFLCSSRAVLIKPAASYEEEAAAAGICSPRANLLSPHQPSLFWEHCGRSLRLVNKKKTGRNKLQVMGRSSWRAHPRRLHDQINGAFSRWWEKSGGPNMVDIHSSEELLEALVTASNKLVVVEYYATWCAACRALYPEVCNLAVQHKEVQFLNVNATENMQLCKAFKVKVFPLFQFYRGPDGLLDSFSCTLSKLHKLRHAIAKHNTDRCFLL